EDTKMTAKWDLLVRALQGLASGAQVLFHEIPAPVVAEVEERFGIKIADHRRRMLAEGDRAKGLQGVTFEPGLTDREVREVEDRFAFRFPPDLRSFLQTTLICGEGFPNWRSGDESALREWLNQPLKGILSDIEHAGFWLPEWGPTPTSL